MAAAMLLGCGGGGGDDSASSTSGPGTSTSGGATGASGGASGTSGAPGALFGRVTDSRGTAISRATFSLSTRGSSLATTVSDSFGNYFFASVPSGVTLVLTARAPGGGLTPRVVSIFVNPAETQQLNLILASIVPTIVSSSPTPLTSNVPISIQPRVVFNVPLDSTTVTTGATGTVQLSRIRPSPVLAVEGRGETSIDNTGRSSILFTPRFNLAEGSAYEFRLGNTIRDQFGTAFAGAVIPFSTQGLPRGAIVSGPAIVASVPADRATTVSPDTAITFTFDRPLDPATVNTTNISLLRINPPPTLQDTGGRVRQFAGIRNTFEYVPGAQLALGNTYTLSITEGVLDTEGNRATPTAIRFTMRAFGPRVLASNPVDRQQGVPVTQNFIQLTFDETVRFASATNVANYLLTFQQRGGGIVSQQISAITSLASPPNTVRLTIATPLQANTPFTLTYNNIEDINGNLSVPGQNIIFTTTNLGDGLPPRVISSTPANGQRDVSLDSLLTVTWSETMAAGVLNIASYDFLDENGPLGIARVEAVTGVANTFRLTPRILPLQPLQRHTLLFRPESLTDSVGNQSQTTGIQFVTAAGNANLLDRLGSVPRDGEPAFQPTVTNGTLRPHFTRRMVQSTIEDLSNYTLTEAPNTRLAITFAQVVPSSNNTEVVLQPARALRANTDYTLVFSPNLRAADGTNMPANTSLLFRTGPFGDITAPVILTTFPRNLATSVSVSTAIQVQYSEQMGASATNPANYFISSDLEPAFSPQAAVSLISPPNSVQLTLPRALRSLTQYTFTATQLVLDSSGNALPTTSVVFTTGTTTGGSLEPPRVVTSNPAAGSTGVSTGTGIILQFSEEMNEGQLGETSSVFNSTNYTLASTETGAIPLLVERPAIALNTYRLRPAQTLRGNTVFTFLASNNIVNRFNVPLTPFTLAFQTINIGDSVSPRLTGSIPSPNQQNVNPAEAITLFFSEEMNIGGSSGSAINSGNYVLFTSSGRSVPLSSTVEAGPGLPNTSFRLRASQPMAAQTTHTLTISGNLRDVAGNKFTPLSLSFTTGETGTTGDATPPFVAFTTPSNGSTGIATSTPIVVTFSEAMRTSATGSALDPDNYVLFAQNGAIPILSVLPADSPANTFVLSASSLLPSTVHTVLFTSNLRDLAGNALRPGQLSFVTADSADRTPPSLLASNPINDGFVTADAVIYLTFSEPMDANSVLSKDNYLLTTSGGQVAIDTIVQAPAPANTFIITPQRPLLGGQRYVLSLTANIHDLNQLPLVPNALVFFVRDNPGGPGDVTPPVVGFTNPSNNEEGVGTNTLIQVVFSEAMNMEVSGSPGFGNSALNPSNYIVRVSESSEPVAGVKVNRLPSPANAVLINAGTLNLNSLVRVQLSDRIQDTSGNALLLNPQLPALPATFSFFTGARDRTAPQIIGSGILTTTSIYIQFSERMENRNVLDVNNYHMSASCAPPLGVPQIVQVVGIPGTPVGNGSQVEITGVEVFFSTQLSQANFALFLSPLITDLEGISIGAATVGLTVNGGCGD